MNILKYMLQFFCSFQPDQNDVDTAIDNPVLDNFVVDNAEDVEMVFNDFRHGYINANIETTNTEDPKMPGQEGPETEIPGPVRPDPNTTLVIDGNVVSIDDIEFLIDGNVIPMDDVELTFDDANENPTIVNAGHQEPVNAADQIPDNAGDQAPSRSIRSQIRDRTSLIQNNPRDTVIDGAGILLGSLTGNKYPGTSASNKIVQKLKLVKEFCSHLEITPVQENFILSNKLDD